MSLDAVASIFAFLQAHQPTLHAVNQLASIPQRHYLFSDIQRTS